MFVSDVDVAKPDERSIMTYVAQLLERDPNKDEDFSQEELNALVCIILNLCFMHYGIMK